MKRELNSRSRRKWVAGGVLVFGSIALLSTGFATWVIGANQTYKEGEITVNVETATNKSIILDGSLSESALTLCEASEISGQPLVNTENVGTQDLVVTFSFTLSVGKNATKPTKLDVVIPTESLDATPAAMNENNFPQAAKNLIGTTYRAASASGWSYVDLVTTEIALDAGTWNTLGTVDTYAGSATITFTWGTFFGNASPATYYNNKYSNSLTAAEIMTLGDNIEQEINAFHDDMHGANKLTIRVSC